MHSRGLPLLLAALALAVLIAACSGRASTAADPSPQPPTDTASLPGKTLTWTPLPTETPTPPVPTETPLPPTAIVPPIVRLAAVGDLMLARSIGDRILTEGADRPFRDVAALLAQADLTVANLECAISERGQPEPKAYAFRAPPASADSLAAAGIDLVSLANNHALDYGREALADTLAILDEHGIAAVGASRAGEQGARAPVTLERNGLRVAFLAYVDVPVESSTGFDTRAWIAGENTAGVAWGELDDIADDVAAARSLADLVVVLFHFGWEGRTGPSPAQQAQARAAIDAGAALVLGSHPHVLQRAEAYKGGLIVYSLGNFVFDGFRFPENYSAIFTLLLTPDGVAEYDWVPIVLEAGLPRPARPDEAATILSMVQPIE